MCKSQRPVYSRTERLRGELRRQTWERVSELPVLAEPLSEDSDEGDATNTKYETRLAGRVSESTNLDPAPDSQLVESEVEGRSSTAVVGRMR